MAFACDSDSSDCIAEGLCLAGIAHLLIDLEKV